MKKHYVYEGPFMMKNKEGEQYKLTIRQDCNSENPREWYNVATFVCFHRHYDLGDIHHYDDIHEALEALAQDVGIEYEGKNTNELMVSLQYEHYCIKPLYLYDHSGITMSTSHEYPYNDRWDAGCVGFAYISKKVAFRELVNYVLDENGEKIKEEHNHENGQTTWGYKTEPLTEETWKKRASEIIDNEVDTYDMYLRGEVYGYILKKEELIETRCPHCNELIESHTEWVEEDSCWGFYGDVLEDNGILDNLSNNLCFIKED